jgi:L-aminopeptidase/D-esterase-like protein
MAPFWRSIGPAIEIGIGSYEEGPTGVTVIRFPKRASVAVDVRGGAPGTVNTDMLRLGYGRPFTDAIVFSGGSAYGEETITAVATGLKDDGIHSGDFTEVAAVPARSSTISAVAVSTRSIRTSDWRRPHFAPCGRACFRRARRAPDGWPCRAAISDATRIPGRAARSARSAPPGSPPLRW